MALSKKTITYILSIATFLALIVLFSLYKSYKKQMLTQKYLKNGGFIRTRLAYNLNLQHDFTFSPDSYNIAYVSPDQVGIRAFRENKIFAFRNDNTKMAYPLTAIGTEESIFEIKEGLEPGTLDVYKNNDRTIISYNLANASLTRKIKAEHYYDKAIHLQGTIYLTLADDEKGNTMSYKIIDYKGGREHTVRQSAFHVKSMSEDGLLVKWKKGFVRVNFYNHDFYAMDSLLQKTFTAHTIDTVSKLPIVVSMQNGEIMKFKRQPRPVNQQASVKGDTLFVYSLMKGDKDETSFKKTNVFDLYDLSKKGKYIGSIYLDKYKEKRLNDFSIKDNKFVLVYENGLFIYDFSL